MKSTVFFFSIFFALVLSAGIFAQETELETTFEETTRFEDDQFETDLEEKTNRVFFTFNEGATASWLTRIIYQKERSNFVFEDFLPGLYVETDLRNIKYITPMARLAVYYPLISTFNQFPQLPKTPLHFAIDLNLGARFELLNFKYFRLNLGPVLHMFFLNSDRWNYFDMGATAMLGIEVPLFEHWTLLIGGLASLDNGNLGANRTMEPFDMVYQYQVDIGVRYSKKLKNKSYIFARKPKFSSEEPPVILR